MSQPPQPPQYRPRPPWKELALAVLVMLLMALSAAGGYYLPHPNTSPSQNHFPSDIPSGQRLSPEESLTPEPEPPAPIETQDGKIVFFAGEPPLKKYCPGFRQPYAVTLSDALRTIHPGMSIAEVLHLLGNPTNAPGTPPNSVSFGYPASLLGYNFWDTSQTPPVLSPYVIQFRNDAVFLIRPGSIYTRPFR